MRYSHTQTAPLYLLLAAVGATLFTSAVFSMGVTWVAALLLGVGGLMAVLALSFRSLTVADIGDSLSVQFGPLPLFGTRIDYDRMQSVEPGTTSLLDGWGIHYVPGRGWTYNLWGFRCILITIDQNRTVRVGTDDVEGLLHFLQTRLAKP